MKNIMNYKRHFLSLICFLLAVIGSVETSAVSVCGIPMGTEKSEAKSILKERFGLTSVHENSGNLEIFGGQAGGIQYDHMIFYFSWINGRPLLNGATFSGIFNLNDKKNALEYRELIKSIYEKKYRIVEYVNEQGYKSYSFGDGDDCLGYITVEKATSNDGKTRLYSKVCYFSPYDITDDI